MKVKKARSALKGAVNRTVAGALKRRRVPLWRRVCSFFGFHRPTNRLIKKWDDTSKRAAKRAMKKASHLLAGSK